MNNIYFTLLYYKKLYFFSLDNTNKISFKKKNIINIYDFFIDTNKISLSNLFEYN